MRKPLIVEITLPDTDTPSRLYIRDTETAASIRSARRDDVVAVADPLRGYVYLLVRPSNLRTPWPAFILGETDDSGDDSPNVLGVSTLRRLRAFLADVDLPASGDVR